MSGTVTRVFGRALCDFSCAWLAGGPALATRTQGRSSATAGEDRGTPRRGPEPAGGTTGRPCRRRCGDRRQREDLANPLGRDQKTPVVISNKLRTHEYLP